MAHRPRLLVTVLSIPLLVAIGFNYARAHREGEPLAIEFAMEKPFYVPASAGSERGKFVVIRVPPDQQSVPGKNAVTAIKVEPKMEGSKVKVTVYALRGDTDHIISCKDWDALKSSLVGTYIAGLDETVQLIKLKDFGVGVGGDNPLTFRVVPRRVLSPVPQEAFATGCGCGSCDGLICCPNPGYCLTCGTCGTVCCKGGYIEGN
jgi:hypothetical protein